MDNITFERLPEAIGYLIDKVESLEVVILQSKNQQTKEPDNKWFSLEELRAYLPDKPAKSTVYGWICSKRIPNHKSGKRLRFLKSEIDKWLLSSGKRKSEDELQMEAMEYLNRKKGGYKQ